MLHNCNIKYFILLLTSQICIGRIATSSLVHMGCAPTTEDKIDTMGNNKKNITAADSTVNNDSQTATYPERLYIHRAHSGRGIGYHPALDDYRGCGLAWSEPVSKSVFAEPYSLTVGDTMYMRASDVEVPGFTMHYSHTTGQGLHVYAAGSGRVKFHVGALPKYKDGELPSMIVASIPVRQGLAKPKLTAPAVAASTDTVAKAE